MRMSAWRRNAGWMAIVLLAVYAAVHIYLIHKLTLANSVPAYWRRVNLLSGVSPLLPQLLFIAGAYLWFWCTLQGLAHFGDGRPLLPRLDELPKLDGRAAMPMFSRQKAGNRVEDAGSSDKQVLFDPAPRSFRNQRRRLLASLARPLGAHLGRT